MPGTATSGLTYIAISRYSMIYALAMPLLLLTVNIPAQAGHHAISGTPERGLVFGLLPSESPVSKFRRYAPLRDYLARHLDTEIILETARDFPEFRKRTSERKYDFLETAPHFVIPAVDSGKYNVITTIIQPLSAEIVVKTKSKYNKINHLANKIIATPSPQAIITKMGKDVFAQHGLHEGKNIKYRNYKTHNAAYEAVLGGQADAAVISINILNKARRKKEPLKSIAASVPFPNMSILVATDLPPETASTIRKLLTDMKTQEDGKRILKQITYPGYRETSIREFDVLRSYMKK